jgi:hypothetical protein
LATDTASLHLSFGATYLAGFSALSLLIQELQREEFFRKKLPHFDDGETLSAYLSEVGKQVGDRMADSGFHDRVKEHMLRNLGDKITGHRLPDRGADRCYLVTRHEPRLVRRGAAWRLEYRGTHLDVAAEHAAMVRYVLETEIFYVSELAVLSEAPQASTLAMLDTLEKIGVIWRVGS